MSWALAAAFAVLAGGLGYVAVGFQHSLYREPEFREEPLAGRRRMLYGLGLGLTAAITTVLAFRPDHYDFGPALATGAFAFGLLVLASTDFERKRIPNNLSYPLIVAAAALCWVWPDRSVEDIVIGVAVAAGAAAAVYALGAVFGRIVGSGVTVFGLGDVKLILLLGLLLGFPAVLTAVFVGAILAGIPSIPMTFMGRGRSAISYGPYLVAGGLLAMVFPDRFV